MSMDMRPGFFLFEPSGWQRSAFGSVRPGPVLPCSGWIGCGPVLPGFVLLCLFQSIPVYSGLFRSIPVYSGPFRSILFYSILFPSRSSPVQPSPVQPSPVRSGSVPSVLSSPFPPRRSRPVPSQSSLAQPGPAQLGPVRTRACLRERGSGPCRAGSLRAD